nr:T9SS type A sorting domain-containing protein [Saprospiraceae bacterium]
TYGNGLYRSELSPNPVQTVDPNQENYSMTIHTSGDVARIFLPTAINNDVNIHLLDMKGNFIANLSRITFLSEHILETALPTLPAGVYIFNVRSGTKNYSQKVVKIQ